MRQRKRGSVEVAEGDSGFQKILEKEAKRQAPHLTGKRCRRTPFPRATAAHSTNKPAEVKNAAGYHACARPQPKLPPPEWRKPPGTGLSRALPAAFSRLTGVLEPLNHVLLQPTRLIRQLI